MKQYYLVLLAALMLIACKKDVTHDNGEYAFLGGEIINPNSPYLILSKFEKVLDTITLDDNNRFLYKIDNLDAGLYSFSYGGEFQLVLLESRDSIMFRLNTIDFDESLVFTGKGAKKNNYLINMFLETEVEEEKVLGLSQLLPEKFEARLDEIKEAKTKKLQAFNKKHSNSELFNKIAQANIDYNYYLSKEVYPFAYYGNNELKNLESLPEDFYSYRKDINYNNSLIKGYFPYYTFLRYHFNNLALTKHFEHSNESHFDRNSLCYNIDKVHLIDSLTTDDDIKNNLLYHNVIRYVNSTKNVESCDVLLKSFFKKSTDESNKKQLAMLTKRLKTLRSGNEFPNVALVDYNNSEVEIQSLIKKPTIIYFWTYALRGHFKDSHKKVKQLKAKYPEFDFIGININGGDPKLFGKTLKRYNFSTENEYQFVNPDESKEILALNSISKVMLVDKNGNITLNNANLFSYKFEEQLLGLINR